jgi:hypothetical protein
MSEIDRLLQGYGSQEVRPQRAPDPHWAEDMRAIWAAERKGERECQEREARQALAEARRQVTK